MSEVFHCADLSRLSAFREKMGPSVACMGVFDGLHLGHRYIIDQTRAHAAHAKARSLIITFDIDPDELFHASELKKLSTNEARIMELAKADSDYILVLPFSRAFAALLPDEFLTTCLEPLDLIGLHVGSDFRFGARAKGNVDSLRAWGSCHDVEIVGHDLLDASGAPITSSRIRALLKEGDIDSANALLGHPYAMRGTVVRGRGEGSGFGFSTANLSVPDQCLAISEGVYGARAIIGTDSYKAAVSVGVSPTFHDSSTANVEAHILDFEGDLYGAEIEIRFLAWLRPMMRFESTEALISTVTANIEWVRQNC